MLISPSFKIYLLLWVTVALASFCIKAPAQSPPPSAPLSSCSFLSPDSSWLSKKDPLSNVTLLTDDDLGRRNLTLFKQTTFPLQANISISASFSFTASNYSTEDQLQKGAQTNNRAAASLAFILARSPPQSTVPSSLQSMEVTFGYEGGQPTYNLTHFRVCKDLPQQDLQIIPASNMYSCLRDPDDEAFPKDEFSLTYLADIAELSVQVAHNMVDGCEFLQTFNFSTNNNESDDGSTTLFVGYITSGKPSINVTMGALAIFSTPLIVVSTLDDETNSSTHIKKVVSWVLVGIFTMGTFIILVLLIKKRHGRRPPNSSHPLNGHGSPPLARRAPFSYHDLESNATPMSAPSLSPVHSNAFQISSTASWLKQPNPR